MEAIRKELSRSYQELNDETDPIARDPEGAQEEEQEEAASAVIPDRDSDRSNTRVRFSRTCLKNVFSVLLIFVYLLLMGVAVFLVYQTITDFRDKLKHPVMSVSYKEVNVYDAPGIALYPGKARLLSCKHHLYDHIPPLIDPGQPGENTCITQNISYTDPYTNSTVKHALIVQGPRDVRRRELVFLQFHLNETKQDFSAIDYLLFSSYDGFLKSTNRVRFMQDCESSFSSWKFSGGFRTWVKMSLVKTKEEDGSQSVEFRQETSVVNFIDRRENPDKGDQLFFVVFEWKDPYIQEIQDIITANPWSMIALLCSVFLVLFKAADFAKLSVKWMIKVRRRHLKKRTRELNHIS
ncbi:proton-activated chloride channel [Xenopus laevis]|uniref:Proton-activated chloride channel n=2 Tax=Xenopus laevis TaxID=8355 RepID=A0A974CU54_XENLA|nr:proton-activated chloride channel [Xenopus laevis]OCT79393.1 hypothetical protein XELAEV_18026206mg [Xenopus laevis]